VATYLLGASDPTCPSVSSRPSAFLSAGSMASKAAFPRALTREGKLQARKLLLLLSSCASNDLEGSTCLSIPAFCWTACVLLSKATAFSVSDRRSST
jgi:hypothetical protein